MVKKRAEKSRYIVVDANVVRAAGNTDKGVSSKCREVLQAIRDLCHRIVLTDKIKEEWKKHMRSKFSRRWHIAMQNKRHSEISGLASIVFKGISQTDKEIIEKDRHLIDAAIANDHIIITMDMNLQRALERSGNDKFLNEIKWINPLTISRISLEEL